MVTVRMPKPEGDERPDDRYTFHIDPEGAWLPCDWQALAHWHIPNSLRVLYQKQCCAMDELIDQGTTATLEQRCAFLRREVMIQYVWRLTRDLLEHQHRRADLRSGSADSVSLDQLLERVARRAIEDLQHSEDYSNWVGSAIFDSSIHAVRKRLPELASMLDGLLNRQNAVVFCA